MDEILDKDRKDLERLLYQIGPAEYNGYFNITLPAIEAVSHLFATIDKLQNRVCDLEYRSRHIIDY